MKKEKISIEGKDYIIKIGFGVMLLWEKEENKAITAAEGKDDIMKLAYYSLQYNNEHFTHSYKSFIDEILDENPEVFIQIIEIITRLLFDGGTDKPVKKKK